jgi:hypothetical protein
LVEHEQNASRVNLVQRDRRQGLRFERHTLMHGVGS